MPLPGDAVCALCPLGSIKANAFPLRRRLDTLAGGPAGRRFRQAALALPFPLAHGVHDVPHTTTCHHCLPPVATIAIDRAGSAAMRGHHAPLAPDFVDVEHAIEDAVEVHGLLGRMGAGPAGVEGEPIAQRSHLWDSDLRCSSSLLLPWVVCLAGV